MTGERKRRRMTKEGRQKTVGKKEESEHGRQTKEEKEQKTEDRRQKKECERKHSGEDPIAPLPLAFCLLSFFSF